MLLFRISFFLILLYMNSVASGQPLCTLPVGTLSTDTSCNNGEAGCTVGALAASADTRNLLTCAEGYKGNPDTRNVQCLVNGGTFDLPACGVAPIILNWPVNSGLTHSGQTDGQFYGQAVSIPVPKLNVLVPYNNIQFNFVVYDQSPAHYAVGTLHILSAPYTGTPADLSTSASLIASSVLVDDSSFGGKRWTFPPEVELSPPYNYYFYMESQSDKSLSSHANGYPDGVAYISAGQNGAFLESNGDDLDFFLYGLPKVNAPPQAANDNVVFPADRPGTHLPGCVGMTDGAHTPGGHPHGTRSRTSGAARIAAPPRRCRLWAYISRTTRRGPEHTNSMSHKKNGERTPVKVTPRGEAVIVGDPPVRVTLVEDEGPQHPPLVEEEHPTPHPRMSSRVTSGLYPPPPALAAPRRAITPRSANSIGTLSACRLLGPVGGTKRRIELKLVQQHPDVPIDGRVGEGLFEGCCGDVVALVPQNLLHENSRAFNRTAGANSIGTLSACRLLGPVGGTKRRIELKLVQQHPDVPIDGRVGEGLFEDCCGDVVALVPQNLFHENSRAFNRTAGANSIGTLSACRLLGPVGGTKRRIELKLVQQHPDVPIDGRVGEGLFEDCCGDVVALVPQNLFHENSRAFNRTAGNKERKRCTI